MTTVVAPDTALRRIQRSCDEAVDGNDLFERLSHDMHELVPHDGAVWFGADPVTLLISSPVRIEAMEASACDTFWHNEFHVQDAAQFVDLARSPQPAAGLRITLDDHPNRSVRFRELLAPQGYDDELRSVLRVGESTWGLLGLVREKGRAAFSADEVAIVNQASPVIAGALRHHVRAQSTWLGASSAPGLLVFDDRSRVVSANIEALGWLRALVTAPPVSTHDDDRSVLRAVEDLLASDELDRQISPLWALLNRSRAVGRGIDHHAARLRLRDRRGRWLVLHGTSMQSSDPAPESPVAIVIEPAKSSEIAPIIIEAYSLTPREREVVGALARGDSTSEIAATLYLSPHTVKDHIKTVFEKVEVSSRTELVAKLFAEHYSVPAHADMVHD